MIINADDFGYHAEVNRAIVQAFAEGLGTSTSLMANQVGFAEACELAHENGLVDRVGIHIVLSLGEPLTDRMRRRRRFCDTDGRFSDWRSGGRVFWLPPADRDAVAHEVRAQVDRCRSHGLPLMHLDSHHHVHNEWAIGGVTLRVARDLGIPRVRLARNCGAGIGVVSTGYKRMYNERLRRAGLAGTRYFGDIADWLHLRATGVDASALDDFELMTHPVLDEGARVVDFEHGSRPLANLLAPVLA